MLIRLARLDAIGSAGSALLVMTLTPWVHDLFGLTPVFVWVLGVVLLVWAAWLWLSVAPRPTEAKVRFVLAFNTVWVLGSLILPSLVSLTPLGTVLVVGQALAVAALASSEWLAARRLVA